MRRWNIAKKRRLIELLALALIMGVFQTGCGSSSPGVIEDPYPESQRVVLAELFTQPFLLCPNSQSAVKAMDQLAGDYGPTKLIVLEYYYDNNPDYILPNTIERKDAYGVEYTPTVCFNGSHNKVDKWEGIDAYVSMINAEREKDTEIELTVTRSKVDEEDQLMIDVYNRTDSALENVWVWFVYYVVPAGYENRQVVIYISHSPQLGLLEAGNSESFSMEVETELPDNAGFIAFLQESDTENGEVYQAVQLALD